MKVLKFGGTSVGKAERVENVAKIIKDTAEKSGPPVVVVSAVGGLTDQLLECSRIAVEDSGSAQKKLAEIRQRHFDVYPVDLQDKVHLQEFTSLFSELEEIVHGISLVKECSPRTLDFLLSFGERFSARLMTALLNRTGIAAEYVDARDCVVTEKRHGGARVIFSDTDEKIRKRIRDSFVYIVTGFISSCKEGYTTTLGRGGSDYTAAIFGAALDAEQIEIWTDVDGFMSADPRHVKEAFVLPHVSYEEAMELSYFGARVIHTQTLIPAINKKIPVWIKNSFEPGLPGTKISPEVTDLGHPVKGIASISGLSLLNIQGSGMVGVTGIAGRLFSAMARHGVNITMISQASSEHSICLVIKQPQAEDARLAIEEEFEAERISGKIDAVERTDNLAIIAAVGDNMHGTPGIASKLFGALGHNSINIKAIAQGSSERNVSLVVDSADMVKAVNVIHSAFYLSHRISNIFVIGASGSIGSTLLNQIKERQKELAESNGLILNLCGLVDSDRMVVDGGGIAVSTWKETFAKAEEGVDLTAVFDTIKRYKMVNPIFVDVTASEAVAARYVDILKAGVHIVTPNKKANSREQTYYDSLTDLSREHRLHYYYETTVGAGLPIIRTIKDLKNSGDEILRIEGILSGTLSYLFNTMSAERSFSAVIKEAHGLGYTEPDPRDDLSGLDVARKILILSREIGLKMELDDIDIEALLPAEMTEADLETFWNNLPRMDERFESERLAAEKSGMAMRYIASLIDGHCRVAIEKIPLSHALARSGATDNIIQITTKRYSDNPLIIRGPGAGRDVTAGGVFADIISLSFHLP